MGLWVFKKGGAAPPKAPGDSEQVVCEYIFHMQTNQSKALPQTTTFI